jgi:alpha-beta hydrolase superfamily lysophospholipase
LSKSPVHGKKSGLEAAMTRTPEIETWTNAKGEKFRLVHWPHPDGPQKTLLLIHHGHGEHAERWQTLVNAVGDLPVDIRSYDLRGHGKSEGKRGDAEGYGHFADDLLEILPAMVERSGAVQVILMGHSMGAAAVAYTLLHRPLPENLIGVILSSGLFLMPRTVINSIKIELGKIVGSIVPGLQMSTGQPHTRMTRDIKEAERYRDDPLVHDKVTTRLGKSWANEGEALPDLARNFPDVPLLIYHGTGDKTVDPQGSYRFAKNVPNQDKVKYVEFDGYYHEPHHEAPEDAQRVFDMWRSWLEERID